MSLTELKAGNNAVVESISGGRHLRHKLVNMGLIPGIEVGVVRASRMGPMVLSLHGTQIILGAGMASKIYVRQL